MIKKDVLMNESNLSEEVGDIENMDNVLKFEDVEINTLINISTKYIENEYKVDLDESSIKIYESVEDIKRSIERTGIAKISWFINEIEKPQFTYSVVINSFGEILYSEIIK